jgi:hypothetical protein
MNPKKDHHRIIISKTFRIWNFSVQAVFVDVALVMELIEALSIVGYVLYSLHVCVCGCIRYDNCV